MWNAEVRVRNDLQCESRNADCEMTCNANSEIELPTSEILQSLLYRLVNRILYPWTNVQAGQFIANTGIYTVR